MRRRDLLWLLAYPAYQVIGTIRHEGCHALAAWLEGATIRRFVVLPRFDDRHGLLWGYVSWDGSTTWLATAAPYFGAFLSFAVLFPLCLRVRSPRWLRINLVILGVISPLVDTLYAYVGGLFRPFNDVALLLRKLPPWVVHASFLAAIAVYAAALGALLGSRRQSAEPRDRPGA